jgi:hypothetical protein
MSVHQGGGFSPKRLRAMLLGVERRRKDAGTGNDDGGEQKEEYGAVPMASVRSDSDARSEHLHFPSLPHCCRCPPALLDLDHFVSEFWVPFHCTCNDDFSDLFTHLLHILHILLFEPEVGALISI